APGAVPPPPRQQPPRINTPPRPPGEPRDPPGPSRLAAPRADPPMAIAPPNRCRPQCMRETHHRLMMQAINCSMTMASEHCENFVARVVFRQKSRKSLRVRRVGLLTERAVLWQS